MKKCPSCRKKFDPVRQAAWLPFCSQRCKLIDLGAWLKESHRIPAENIDSVQSNQNTEKTTH